jgi:hypothetical protein
VAWANPKPGNDKVAKERLNTHRSLLELIVHDPRFRSLSCFNQGLY